MSERLIIPRIEVKGANAQSAYWLVTGPSPLAYMGLVRNLAIKLGVEDSHQVRVAVVHHHLEMRGEVLKLDKFSPPKLIPSQLRGQSFSSPGKGYTNDYVKDTLSMSLQPVALCNLCVTLIIEGFGDVDVSELHELLFESRLAGGTIVDFQRIKSVDSDNVFQSIPSGFFMKERSDLMAESNAENRIETFIQAFIDNNDRKGDSNKKWLMPINLGFCSLTDDLADEEMPEMLAEPLVGIIEYQSKNQCEPESLDDMFWGYRSKDKAFFVSQN